MSGTGAHSILAFFVIPFNVKRRIGVKFRRGVIMKKWEGIQDTYIESSRGVYSDDCIAAVRCSLYLPLVQPGATGPDGRQGDS